MSIPGAPPPTRTELARVSDRLSFVYLERCAVHRDANAVTATSDKGVLHIPAATLGCLLLGPGTRVTNAAMTLLGDCGASVVWCGENGVRFYAHGSSLARSSRMLQAQAELVSNSRARLDIARKMYAYRFPGEDVSTLTMQQLRGREGARVRRIYREHAERTGVTWGHRDYNINIFEDSNPINQALSAANAALYGVVHSVIVALGCAPGLGFVHTGKEKSFIYDIADLYKAEITIPAAFNVVAAGSDNLTSDVRRAVRDAVVTHKLLAKCARDVSRLLVPDIDTEWEQIDELSLWAGPGKGTVNAGINYAGDTE